MLYNSKYTFVIFWPFVIFYPFWRFNFLVSMYVQCILYLREKSRETAKTNHKLVLFSPSFYLCKNFVVCREMSWVWYMTTANKVHNFTNSKKKRLKMIPLQPWIISFLQKVIPKGSKLLTCWLHLRRFSWKSKISFGYLNFFKHQLLPLTPYSQSTDLTKDWIALYDNSSNFNFHRFSCFLRIDFTQCFRVVSTEK